MRACACAIGTIDAENLARARGVMLLPSVMISMKNIPWDGIRQTRSDNELKIQALL